MRIWEIHSAFAIAISLLETGDFRDKLWGCPCVLLSPQTAAFNLVESTGHVCSRHYESISLARLPATLALLTRYLSPFLKNLPCEEQNMLHLLRLKLCLRCLYALRDEGSCSPPAAGTKIGSTCEKKFSPTSCLAPFSSHNTICLPFSPWFTRLNQNPNLHATLFLSVPPAVGFVNGKVSNTQIVHILGAVLYVMVLAFKKWELWAATHSLLDTYLLYGQNYGLHHGIMNRPGRERQRSSLLGVGGMTYAYNDSVMALENVLIAGYLISHQQWKRKSN